MKQATERALAHLTHHGLRVTEARKTLINSLASFDAPASITEIAERTDIDTATVYRNIKTLFDIGVLETITLDDGTIKYALAHDHHHDHIVCTNCGTIVHIPCTAAHTHTISHPDFASISHHNITYFGLCTRCAHSQPCSS